MFYHIIRCAVVVTLPQMFLDYLFDGVVLTRILGFEGILAKLYFEGTFALFIRLVKHNIAIMLCCFPNTIVS